MKLIFLSSFAALVFSVSPGSGNGAASHIREISSALMPQLKVGDHLSDLFSVSSAITVEGFDPIARRNGGSADYVVRRVGADGTFELQLDDQYDGFPRDHYAVTLSDQGSRQCLDGKCAIYTDASGLIFNRLMWGRAPAALKPGMTWTVSLEKSWELGPAGSQTVTVVSVDPAHGEATLKREGRAAGFFANEPASLTLTKAGSAVEFKVEPGRAHWIGYTRFRRGVVVNDELLVTRVDTLISPMFGQVSAQRRRLMLLNAAPYPTL